MNFSVDSQILTNIGPNLSTIENEIKNSANAAYDIGKQMRLKSLASEILSLKLRSNARTIMSLADNVKSYRTALKNITQEYVTYEAAIREEFLPASGGVRRVRNLTQESGIFDDHGSYGGDQGDMIDNQAKKQILWWTIGGNQALYDAVRTYPQYADYSDGQIKKLFEKIKSAFPNNEKLLTAVKTTISNNLGNLETSNSTPSSPQPSYKAPRTPKKTKSEFV